MKSEFSRNRPSPQTLIIHNRLADDMTHLYKTSIIAGLLSSVAMTASAHSGAQLHDKDMRMVAAACANGDELLPVSTDVEQPPLAFALPIRSASGEIVTAIIISKEELSDISACENFSLATRRQVMVNFDIYKSDDAQS